MDEAELHHSSYNLYERWNGFSEEDKISIIKNFKWECINIIYDIFRYKGLNKIQRKDFVCLASLQFKRNNERFSKYKPITVRL